MKKMIKQLILKLKNKTCELHSRYISADIKLGKNVKIYNNVYIGHNCNIGDFSYINPNSYIDDNTKVGKYCSISRSVIIGIGNHDIDGITTHPIGYSHYWNELIEEDNIMLETKIGNDVWIGAGSILLNGINVGDGAVIGAGAVVTKDVDPYSIVAGVPAKEIKKRKCIDNSWWDLPVNEIKQLIIDNKENKKI